MRTKALAAALALALAFGCGKSKGREQQPVKTAAPAAPAMTAADLEERQNLLNIAYGASVVSRTAENALEASAIRAIDGDSASAWSSPPDDPRQTMVFALPARSRIEQIGVRMPAAARLRVKTAEFETSLDGEKFTPLLKQTFNDFAEIQLFPVTPTEALYVRVNTLETTGRFATIQSVQVRGKLLERPVAQPIDGCWTVNGQPARFTTVGGSIRGVIGSSDPIRLDGAAEGPVYRFAWTKKGDWGFAVLTATPDSKHLSAAKWFQEPIAYDYGDSWFGDRSTCGVAEPADTSVPLALRFLDRLHRYPLFGLHFDETGRLSEPESVTALELLANLSAQHSSQRFRLVSNEYRGASTDDNRRRAQARLDSLRAVLQQRGVDLGRFEFVAAGSDRPPQRIENEIMRVLYSVVDIEPSVEGR